MPRNTQGDYSLPAGSIVSSGDTVLPSQHNPPLQDLEQAVGSSLDRDGKGGMRANLPMNGKKITNMAPGTEASDAVTVSQLGGLTSIPIGAVIDYWGTTPPDGYFFAAGQEVSRTTYAALFAVIGTAAGAGDGSTTFNLPDYRGRVSAGRENMAAPATTRLNTLSSETLGASGGSQTHTLTEAQMPVHGHDVNDPGHRHTYPALSPQAVGDGLNAAVRQTLATSQTNAVTTGITLEDAGGGEAHNNVQPTLICNKIIKVS